LFFIKQKNNVDLISGGLLLQVNNIIHFLILQALQALFLCLFSSNSRPDGGHHSSSQLTLVVPVWF